jgi:hypothetical protein
MYEKKKQCNVVIPTKDFKKMKEYGNCNCNCKSAELRRIGSVEIMALRTQLAMWKNVHTYDSD